MTVDPRKHWKGPKVGSVWTDDEGRILSVQSINLNDRLGRQIVGTLQVGETLFPSYSCDLLIWADVWRDRAPRMAPSMMKIG